MNTEELRQKLIDGCYAGALSGLGAMILDVDDIKNADEQELLKIAKRMGY